MFPCANRTMGQCIPSLKKCDGIYDCKDGSDEKNCACPPGHFKCKNDVCIPEIYHCNGHMDCYDGSDETDCGKVHTHTSSI